jgi:hypothetical protein
LKGEKMKNPEMLEYLETVLVEYPVDYAIRLFMIKSSDDVSEFCDAVIHNLNLCVKEPGRKIKVSLICGIFIKMISGMKKLDISYSKILAAIDVVPRYLKVIIQDSETAVMAVSYFVGETADIRLLVAASL